MVKVKEAIVVEGKYDKNALSQVVDTAIFTTDGFGSMTDASFLSLLRRVAQTRGLVIFTDSDGAGFVIRNKLKGALPKEKVLHAYIPDVYGKEKRKSAPGREGKLGVEGMKPEILLEALRRAGATFEDETPVRKEPISKTDFYCLGLSGRAGSEEKRKKLLQKLSLPEHMSANALLEAINILYGREEFLQYCEETL